MPIFPIVIPTFWDFKLFLFVIWARDSMLLLVGYPDHFQKFLHPLWFTGLRENCILRLRYFLRSLQNDFDKTDSWCNRYSSNALSNGIVRFGTAFVSNEKKRIYDSQLIPKVIIQHNHNSSKRNSPFLKFQTLSFCNLSEESNAPFAGLSGSFVKISPPLLVQEKTEIYV